MLIKTTYRKTGEKFFLRKFCLVIISLVLVSINIQAQNGWTRKANTLHPRLGCCAVVIDNKIYVMGGVDGSLNNYNYNEVYDPLTDTWETKKSMPTVGGLVSVAVVDGIIYAIGGGLPSSETSEVYAYDPVSDTWNQRANLLSPRFGAAAAVIDGIIYNVGGNHTERNCEAYNPLTGTWTRKSDIPETYGGVMVAPYNGLLYVFGGGYNRTLSTTYVYNPGTNAWTKKTNMPTARGWSSPVAVVDGKIYIIGGHKGVGLEIFSDVEVYDPVNDSWLKLPDAPFKYTFFGVAAVNNKIYIIGGMQDWGGTGGNEVWEYDPAYVPVELTSFTATATGKEVTLNWSTATELNNQGFEIQRKFGSNDFVSVGSVKGYGTTTSPNQYSYVDKLVDPGKYFYRLKQIDYGGTFEYSNEIEVEVRVLEKFTLEQNYPNPFNPTTTIGYILQEKSNAKLTLLNALGEEIAILVNEEQDKGYHKVEFNGSNLPSGVYFYQLRAGNLTATKKLLLLK